VPTTTHSHPGLDLPGGGYVSAGLAALVAAALLTLRRRRRIHYRPGIGDRAELTIAPVVRALRVAHEEADSHTSETVPPPATESDGPTTGPPTTDVRRAGTDLGVRDGRVLAWDLARTRGLGLIGPGAHHAARALLVSLLASHHGGAGHRVDVLMPSADAHLLLGADPPGIKTADTLDAALDTLEAELLTRLGAPPTTATPERADLVLVATASEHSEHRLQAILDNGSSLGIAGILLGQWRPGGTARVRADGAVAATSPTLDALTGARLFTLPTTDATDLLDLLHQARPRTTMPTRPPVARDPVGTVRPAPPPTHGAHRERPERGTLGPGRPTAPPDTPTPDHPAEPTTTDPTPPGEDATDEPDPHPPAPRRADPEQALLSQALPSRAWHLTVLGRIRLTHHQPDGAEHADASPALAPKHREVLTYLALHPHGARREALADAIWPTAPTSRPYNSFHATLSQLRRALRAAAHDDHLDITTHTDDGRYALDQAVVNVDLWQLQTVLEETRHTDNLGDQAPVDRVIALYQGDLAADITAEWLDAPRENLRRDVLDVITHRARALRDTHPEQALTLLEHARTFDSYNEALYRTIARLQAHLGQWDAIPRTHALLTTTLAAIDEQPSLTTRDFFNVMERPHPSARVTPNG
jgi:DNA-binding SARP family transcriptional activator